jgi:hypothetical protein
MPGGSIITATALGDVVIHNQEGEHLSSARAHDGAALTLCRLSDAGVGTGGAAADAADRQSDGGCMVMSGGQDCSVKLWRVREGGSAAAVLRCVRKSCT